MYTSSTMHITATAFMFKKAADLLLVIAYYNNWFCTYYNIPLTLQRVLSAASNFVSVSLYQQLLYQYHKTKNNYFKQRLFKQKSEPFLISHKMLHLNKKKNCVFLLPNLLTSLQLTCVYPLCTSCWIWWWWFFWWGHDSRLCCLCWPWRGNASTLLQNIKQIWKSIAFI